MGDHLRVEYGPLRYCLCGMGKTKIMYKDIKHWEVSRSCSYGFGVSFGMNIKLFIYILKNINIDI